MLMRQGVASGHPEQMPLHIGLLHVCEMLAGVVRSASEPSDADFVQLADPAITALDGSTGARLDAVIAGVHNAWDESSLLVTTAHPTVAVLGVRQDGRQTWLYELVPHPRELGELGPAELRAAPLNAVEIVAN